MTRLHHSLVILLVCAAMFCATLLGAGVVAGHHLLGEKPAPATGEGRPEMGAVLLLVLSAPYFIAMSALWSKSFSAAAASPDPDAFQLVMSANTGIVVLTTALLSGGLLLAAGLRARPLPPWLLGGGMIIFALGAALGVLGDPIDGLGGVLLGAVAIAALGEGIVGPLLYARVAGDLNPRFATLVVASFTVGIAGFTFLAKMPESPTKQQILLACAALGALVAGAALLVLVGPMRRWFYELPSADRR